MTTALSETAWIATLKRIMQHDGASDTTRTLAYMLHDIIKAPDQIADILDAYGKTLLGPLR